MSFVIADTLSDVAAAAAADAMLSFERQRVFNDAKKFAESFWKIGECPYVIQFRTLNFDECGVFARTAAELTFVFGNDVKIYDTGLCGPMSAVSVSTLVQCFQERFGKM